MCRTCDGLAALAAEMEREEISRGQISWWFLSFSDGADLRGGCFVSAFGIIDAMNQARMLDIDPSGDISGGAVPPEMEVPEGARRRMLSKDDIVRYFGDVELVRSVIR